MVQEKTFYIPDYEDEGLADEIRIFLSNILSYNGKIVSTVSLENLVMIFYTF